jgi:hypothetical protein
MSSNRERNKKRPPSIPSEDVAARIAKLEEDVSKSKRLSLIATILAVMVGGSGIFGLVEWLVAGPRINRELNQVKLTREKLDVDAQEKNRLINDRLKEMELEKSSFDLQKQKLNEGTEHATGEVNLIKAKLEVLSKAHDEEMNSLKRELANARSNGDIGALKSQLIDHERVYREALSKLQSNGILTQGYNPLSQALNELAGELMDSSLRFEQQVRQLHGTNAASPVLVETKPGTISVMSNPDSDPIVMSDKSRIRFRAHEEVTIQAQGPEGYTTVLVGSLPVAANGSEPLKRLGGSQLVYIPLKNGEKATFQTSATPTGYLDFDIQSIQVQTGSFKGIRGEGEFADAPRLFSLADGEGKLSYAELSFLPKGFRLQISWSIVSEFEPTFLRVQGSQIVPFEHVDELRPGYSCYQDVIDLLGTPDNVEMGEGVYSMYYSKHGLTIHFVKGTITPLKMIESIVARTPFSAKTADGLFIGLPQQDALRILKSHYYVDDSSKEQVIVEKEKGDRQWFIVRFKNGKLSEMQVIAPFQRIKGLQDQ